MLSFVDSFLFVVTSDALTQPGHCFYGNIINHVNSCNTDPCLKKKAFDSSESPFVCLLFDQSDHSTVHFHSNIFLFDSGLCSCGLLIT